MGWEAAGEEGKFRTPHGGEVFLAGKHAGNGIRISPNTSVEGLDVPVRPTSFPIRSRKMQKNKQTTLSDNQGQTLAMTFVYVPSLLNSEGELGTWAAAFALRSAPPFGG